MSPLLTWQRLSLPHTPPHGVKMSLRAAMSALRPASAVLNLRAARRTAGAAPARQWRPVSASAGASRVCSAACVRVVPACVD